MLSTSACVGIFHNNWLRAFRPTAMTDRLRLESCVRLPRREPSSLAKKMPPTRWPQHMARGTDSSHLNGEESRDSQAQSPGRRLSPGPGTTSRRDRA